MNQQFIKTAKEISELVIQWETKLLSLDEKIITKPKNKQNRSIKQILGHLADSAGNNTHRIVHLHYSKDPLIYPNYASHGNNDRWIAIQNYQDENWQNLVAYWKYCNLHLAHMLCQVQSSRLEVKWDAGDGKMISMNECILAYLPHLRLHLGEIEELIA